MDAHPLPRIYEIFDARRGVKYLTPLDLANCYNQVSVERNDEDTTEFVTPCGHYEDILMLF